MRTLPLVLAVVLVNDALLLLALDVAVPTWLVVAGGALGLTAVLAVVVGVAVDEEAPLSKEELRRDVESLRERVEQLED